ncbi:hypothetical protein PCL_07118 [Purpureocillium lilacinum]|uniref:Uncharacterized protein n=1 Tax=Purpureocillium lilacinum TaxID=33203 RepID=A0A2U3DSX2_PURLI|nr:hypothetical protein PCL_07118 [Purpureocillium lilacinum]
MGGGTSTAGGAKRGTRSQGGFKPGMGGRSTLLAEDAGSLSTGREKRAARRFFLFGALPGAPSRLGSEPLIGAYLAPPRARVVARPLRRGRYPHARQCKVPPSRTVTIAMDEARGQQGQPQHFCLRASSTKSEPSLPPRRPARKHRPAAPPAGPCSALQLTRSRESHLARSAPALAFPDELPGHCHSNQRRAAPSTVRVPCYGVIRLDLGQSVARPGVADCNIKGNRDPNIPLIPTSSAPRRTQASKRGLLSPAPQRFKEDPGPDATA